MSRILLGVSGGIAAYKALEVVRLATAAGHAVRVVQTPASGRFVGRASFEALTGGPVLVSEFERDPARGAFPDQGPPEHEPVSHLELVGNADLYLIAPASANTLAKLAGGLADNLLTSCALAACCPVVVAPAMNSRMYEHPATQANLRALRDRGVVVIEPESGRLASKGEQGIGRLAQPERIVECCEALLAGPGEHAYEGAAEAGSATGEGGEGDLKGLRVLVTAGGTREPLDSVRFIGNSSSGRMGIALARAARRRGARVTVIAANVALERPAGVGWRTVSTAGELREACEEEFPACDVLLMAAAVADFRPRAAVAGKIPSGKGAEGGAAGLSIELEPTPDVLAALAARRRPGQTLVGFAAEHGQTLANGRRKLALKRLDAIVVNDISRADIGFESGENEVSILTSSATGHVPRAAKDQVADRILDVVAELRSAE
ncbi:MAG TPA: bifunctional phosphopantothenoylcysteine decarboxylase/phosphopantothenate--cysteine ligase CoaBC [Solirubrobacteraceae bacterium]|nr:bifunctional phosphopantothenoylcysteine decarboxylase/phosphopantothenate--cysteine ligase CoaBC [Solirubrobacteraceae bacterium]